MVHISAKFRENTAMRFWVTVRKLNVTDRRTDGRGALQYLPSRAFGAAGDNNHLKTFVVVTGADNNTNCLFITILLQHPYQRAADYIPY